MSAPKLHTDGLLPILAMCAVAPLLLAFVSVGRRRLHELVALGALIAGLGALLLTGERRS